MSSRKKVSLIQVIKTLTNQDYAFGVIAKLLGVFLAVLLSVFYNRYLGVALRGEAAVLTNYAAIISIILCFGMYQAYPNFKKKEGDIFYPFLNNMTSLYLLIQFAAILIFIFAWQVNLYIRTAIVIAPIQAYIRHINYVVMIESPKRRNLCSIYIALSNLVLFFLFFALTIASQKLLIILIIAELVINLLLSYSSLKFDLSRFRFTLSLVPKYARFGFVPMLTLLLITLNYRVDIFMLDMETTVTNAQIGIYSVGVTLAESVWIIPDAIKDILLSRLCKDKGADEVARIIRLNLVVSVVITVLIALMARPLVLILYGAEYLGADVITLILLFGGIGMIFYKMIYVYNISVGKQKNNLLYFGIAVFVNIIGNYFFIPLMGIYGAALVSAVAYCICGAVFLFTFHKETSISLRSIIIIQKSDFTDIKQLLKAK